MTNNEVAHDHFGCECCWPEEAESAWSATRKLVRDTELIDESHFHILIVKCYRDCFNSENLPDNWFLNLACASASAFSP